MLLAALSRTGFPYGGDDFLSSKPQVNALNVQGRRLGTNGGNFEFAPIPPFDLRCVLLVRFHSSVALYEESQTGSAAGLKVDINASRGYSSRFNGQGKAPLRVRA